MNKRYQTGYIKQKPYSLNTPSFNLADLRLEDIPETPSMLNSNDWLNNIGSIAGGISGVIGTSLQNSRIGDTSDVEDQINSAANYKVGAYSNESLLDEWGNYNPLDYVTYSDIRGGNVAQRGLNTLSSIGSGAMGGASIGGPIGAIIGGVAGLGSSIAGWLTGNAKARRKVKELNDKIDAANRHVQSSFVNSARSIDEINDMSILSNYSAYGGPINTHGGVFDNGVTIVGNGGTHEENPLEGVQMGVDEQGIPNLVEEGEVIFNDYVFSNRIEAPKNLKRRYKFKGKTFADVAKSIQKESEERPNDPISKAGLDVNMARLAMSQEEVRNSKMKKRTSNKYAGGGVLPYMRYAPAVGAGINALTDLIGSTNKYDYSNVDLIQDVIDNLQTVSYKPVGNYLTYRPFDRNFYINKLNSQASATRRAIEGLSGGNRATKIAGIVASDYNTQGRLGDLARQAEEYNLAQRERVEAFNRGTNQLNSEMGLRAGQINKQNDELRLKSAITQAQLRDQIDSAVSAARSANLNNFLDSLGDIGREETIFNLINSNPGLRYGYAGRTGNIGYKTRSKGGYLTIKKKK